MYKRSAMTWIFCTINRIYTVGIVRIDRHTQRQPRTGKGFQHVGPGIMSVHFTAISQYDRPLDSRLFVKHISS